MIRYQVNGVSSLFLSKIFIQQSKDEEQYLKIQKN